MKVDFALFTDVPSASRIVPPACKYSNICWMSEHIHYYFPGPIVTLPGKYLPGTSWLPYGLHPFLPFVTNWDLVPAYFSSLIPHIPHTSSLVRQNCFKKNLASHSWHTLPLPLLISAHRDASHVSVCFSVGTVLSTLVFLEPSKELVQNGLQETFIEWILNSSYKDGSVQFPKRYQGKTWSKEK